MSDESRDGAAGRDNVSPALMESIHAAKDTITLVTLVAAAVYLAANDHGQLAATALGGALSYAIPSSNKTRVPPIALGLIGGSLVGFFIG